MKLESVIPYRTCHHKMKTGDVIVFSTDGLPSTVVKIATRSEYVHTAIVLFTHQEHTSAGSVVIAESHVDVNRPSLGTGEKIMGAQHQWLEHRLKAQGKVWWLPLKVPLVNDQRLRLQNWLQEIEAQQVPYDFGQVAGAALDMGDTMGLENTPDDKALFCSELVTRALQIAGVVESHINAAEQVPADIIQFPCFQPPVLIKS
ncbi:MAG: hypothetical protein AAF329_02960 [Cyanobacteria bacterium P01_A01_bin.17]